MANITLKGIPVKIHKALKQRAKNRGRSLNREIIAILSDAVSPKVLNVDEFLSEVRELRESMPEMITDDFIDKAKKDGRP